MNIKMYNVGFGECCLLTEHEECLLVDFGSDTPGRLRCISNALAEELYGKKISILLTHFHKDHINGMWETNLKDNIEVDDIYIPDIFGINQNKSKISFLDLHILSDVLDSVKLQNRPQITLYDLLINLSGLHTKVHFLKKGDKFRCVNKELQVLWPDINNITLHARVENSLFELLAIHKTEKRITNNNQIDLFEIISKFSDVLSAGFININAENYSLGSLEESYMAFLEEVDQWKRQLSYQIRDKLVAKVNSIKNQENRISIVFQDRPNKGASSVLMTGDIPSAELKKILSCRTNNYDARFVRKYKTIKAPHHGTNSYFFNQLPECDFILISNGAPLSSHNRWGRISYQYGAYYGSHKSCTIRCTSKRCELHDFRGVNNCHNCDNNQRDASDGYIQVKMI